MLKEVTSVAPTYAVVDLETSALSPEYGRIIEVGIVQLSAELEVEQTWQTLLNPGAGVGRSDIHGIRRADVLDAPTFGQVADKIAELLNGRIIVAHNTRFDLSFLHAEYHQLGRRVHLPALCTCIPAKHFIPTPSRSLQSCCETTGITRQRVHSALGDATDTAELFTLFMRLAADGKQIGRTAYPTEWQRVITGEDGVSEISFDPLAAVNVPIKIRG
ncbi:3'-5' exonuclease [Actinomycetaceae bacterium TAE3-ERU4]|nr:3'-5' exonuclease [Actinomycetaceae bacterium TAE3-ERU4]